MNGYPDHKEIVTITRMAVNFGGTIKHIITEYRADGCVTWREAT